jgi:hypothetical protein
MLNEIPKSLVTETLGSVSQIGNRRMRISLHGRRDNDDAVVRARAVERKKLGRTDSRVARVAKHVQMCRCIAAARKAKGRARLAGDFLKAALAFGDF